MANFILNVFYHNKKNLNIKIDSSHHIMTKTSLRKGPTK